MAQKRISRKKYWYKIIREWESSGLTQVRFFQEKGIAKSTFGLWRKKYLQEYGKSCSAEFIPVNITNGQPSLPIAEQIELIYPNGVRLVCPAQIDMLGLKRLIDL